MSREIRKKIKFNLHLKDIGARLKSARKALNYTQKEMGRMCGVPSSTISEMESGVKKPHPAYLYLLSNEFNVNIHWILTGKGALFMPYFEFKWDFGQDSQRIMEMIYLMEQSPSVRYEMLAHFIKFLDSNKDMIKDLLPEKLNK